MLGTTLLRKELRNMPTEKRNRLNLQTKPSKRKRLFLEACLVLRAGDAQIASILVERYDAHGHPRLAKPCKTCQQMLKAFGVQEIRYTTSHGIETQEV